MSNNSTSTVATKSSSRATAQNRKENPAFAAYSMACKEAMQAGQVHGKSAYAVQALLLAGKPVSKEQMSAYRAFAALVRKAQDACLAVKGKASPCGIFNYLDGRETGYKVATGLGNSVSIRAFLVGLETLVAKQAKAHSKGKGKGKSRKPATSDQAQEAQVEQELAPVLIPDDQANQVTA